MSDNADQLTGMTGRVPRVKRGHFCGVSLLNFVKFLQKWLLNSQESQKVSESDKTALSAVLVNPVKVAVIQA